MKYYIIAGEASGDMHGSNLMQALCALDPQAEIRFWGGDRMAAVAQGHAAITQVRHIRDLAYMGYVEVLSHLGKILGNISFCKEDILQFQPDAMVFIDYPGFNLKIAKFTHRQNIKNVYYISPQIWAWKKGRIKSMRRDLDRLCYILPSERDFFAHNDFPQALYVGHPLLDEVNRYHNSTADTEVLPLASSSDTRPLVALLPGSRKQELRKMLPPMLALAQRHPECHFVVAGMSLLGEPFYKSVIGEAAINVSVVYDNTYSLLAQAHCALVCSGTATLETALFRVPQVVCYKANALSIAIAKKLVKLKYISLVNLIADRPIVRELIQEDFENDTLEQEFQKICVSVDNRTRMLEGYEYVIDLLGNAGASTRTAQQICDIAARKN